MADLTHNAWSVRRDAKGVAAGKTEMVVEHVVVDGSTDNRTSSTTGGATDQSRDHCTGQAAEDCARRPSKRAD